MQLEDFEKNRFNKDLHDKLGWSQGDYDRFLKGAEQRTKELENEVAQAEQELAKPLPPPGAPTVNVSQGGKVAGRKDDGKAGVGGPRASSPETGQALLVGQLLGQGRVAVDLVERLTDRDGRHRDGAVQRSVIGEVAGVTLANFAASTGTPQTWQTFAGSTTIVTAGNYLVDFVFNTNLFPSKDVVIDQVYIIAGNPPLPVPEPATIAVIGIAMLGLGLVRRKSKTT